MIGTGLAGHVPYVNGLCCFPFIRIKHSHAANKRCMIIDKADQSELCRV